MKQNKVKKQLLPESSGRVHADRKLADDLLRFSFRHFMATEKFCYPPIDEKPNYLGTLMERLRDVSGMRVSEFRSAKHKAIRAHRHEWPDTSEPDGYAHLNEQLKQCEPWQFCLSANEYGRVHGILIDEVFYVVWLDHCHALYPEKKV